MKQPFVSILMTAYNREKYIEEAIRSVLNSTFSDFELIIVDDCSSDNTVGLAKNYLADERVRLYVNPKNLGQFRNRNYAASLAVGMFIKYFDSDDIIYPHGLQLLIDGVTQYPEACMALSNQGDSFFKLPHMFTSEEALLQHYTKGGLLFMGPSGTIIKRSDFLSVGGFEDYGVPSDNHLTLKLASIKPIVTVQRDLFFWRRHPDQAFEGETHDINIANNFIFNTSVIKTQKCLSPELTTFLLKNQKKIFLSNLTKLALKGKFLKVFSLYKQSKVDQNRKFN